MRYNFPWRIHAQQPAHHLLSGVLDPGSMSSEDEYDDFSSKMNDDDGLEEDIFDESDLADIAPKIWPTDDVLRRGQGLAKRLTQIVRIGEIRGTSHVRQLTEPAEVS